MATRNLTEHDLQKRCMRWFDVVYPMFSPLMFAVPNAGRRTRSEAGMLKAEGMKAGVADIIFQIPNQHYSSLNIEMKTESKSSRQTGAQRDYEEAILATGGKYVVCRTYEEFQTVVKEYVGGISTDTWHAMNALYEKRYQRKIEEARKEYAALKASV